MMNEKRADLKDYTIVHTFRILHEGWEMDNEGWIARNKKGELVLLMTNHGGLRDHGRNVKELHEKLAETKRSVEGIKHAIKMINGQ
jgi:hypothetical protein